MRPPRLRLRTLMIAVAVVAVWLGIARISPRVAILLLYLLITGRVATAIARRRADDIEETGEQLSPMQKTGMHIAYFSLFSFLGFVLLLVGGFASIGLYYSLLR